MKNNKIDQFFKVNPFIAIAVGIIMITCCFIAYDKITEVNDEYYQIGYKDGQASTNAYLNGFNDGIKIQINIDATRLKIEKIEDLEEKKKLEQKLDNLNDRIRNPQEDVEEEEREKEEKNKKRKDGIPSIPETIGA